MTELEGQLRERIERVNPEPGREALDWSDVVRRAERRSLPRRRVSLAVVLAAAALFGVVATPLGGAIASGMGDFSAWLRGEPGAPASGEDQDAFDEANARTFAGFPEGTQLRSLIKTAVGDMRFELFGFRSGGSLCLRLVLRGAGEPQTGCVPARELATATTPAMVVIADASYGRQDVPPTEEGYVPARASATFGIAADGVGAVELVDDAGRHRAEIGGNAFLHVTDRPRLGLRTRSAWVVGSDGKRERIALAESPFGELGGPVAKPGVAPGPKGVERTVEGGRIGWVDRRDQRGEAPPASSPAIRGPMGRFDFARVLTPDPESHKRVLFGISTLGRFGARPDRPSLCVYLVSGGGAGGGCTELANPFARGPIMASQSLLGGGDQVATISGAISDHVASLEFYLASGARIAVPIADNAFVVEAPRARFPSRLVARDREGRVIGNVEYKADPLARTGPQPVGPWRSIATARAANGEEAELSRAGSSEGGSCFKLRVGRNGAGGSGCVPPGAREPALQLSVHNTPKSSFLSGHVSDSVERLEITTRTGASTLRLVDGYLLEAVPTRGPVDAVGFDENGRVVGRAKLRAEP